MRLKCDIEKCTNIAMWLITEQFADKEKLQACDDHVGALLRGPSNITPLEAHYKRACGYTCTCSTTFSQEECKVHPKPDPVVTTFIVNSIYRLQSTNVWNILIEARGENLSWETECLAPSSFSRDEAIQYGIEKVKLAVESRCKTCGKI